MMKYSMDVYWQLLLFLSMLSSSLCAPLNASSSGLTALIADCYDYEIPVTTQTLAYIFGYPEFSDNFDVVGFIGDVITRTAIPPSFNPFSGMRNITGNYSIGATFCSPKTFNGHEKTVLLASPGLGYDRRYFSSSISPL
jgi:hypothetical protein